MDYESGVFFKSLLNIIILFFSIPSTLLVFSVLNCGERGGMVANVSRGEVVQKEQSTLWTSYSEEEIYVQ